MDLFSLVARLTLDTSEYEKGLDNAESSASSWGSKVGKGLKVAGAVGAAAVTAAAGAAVKLTQASINGYKEYEQLIGGVQTLFGSSAGKVIEDAKAAFQSAGMSMNEYMETSIQSAAALINSLDGDQAKAAELMNVSITDMADNVNKMGTTMEAVQNAYRGFSRGNFTMLDNLALGFAGTKEGMQELLDKAKEISGIEYDISSYSDIVEAIHVVQEEMGIAGTTQAEAAGTIAGSVGSLKSAWDNLVIGLSDDSADIDALMDNVVVSAEAAADNLMPVIEKALTGIGSLIEHLGPVLVEKLPDIIQNLLPKLISAAVNLVASLIANLPQILMALVKALPDILMAILEGFAPLGEGLLSMVVTWIDSIVAFFGNLVDGIREKFDQIWEAVKSFFEPLIDFVRPVLDALKYLFDTIFQAIFVIIDRVMTWIKDKISKVWGGIKDYFTGVLDSIKSIVSKAFQAVYSLIEEPINKAKETISNVFGAIKDTIHGVVDSAKTWGRDLLDNFISGIKEKIQGLADTIRGVADTIKDFIGFSEPKYGPLSNFHTYAPDMMELFAQGIKDSEKLVSDQIADSFDFAPVIQGDGLLASGSPTGGYGGSFGGVGMAEAVLEALRGISVEVIIGQERIDGVVTRAIQRTNYKSGGR